MEVMDLAHENSHESLENPSALNRNAGFYEVPVMFSDWEGLALCANGA